MINNATNIVRRSIEKNIFEIKAVFSGQLPKFILKSNKLRHLDCIPFFVFHDIDRTTFERQLSFLRLNRYNTIDTSDFEKIIKQDFENTKKYIALTFDDATWSFWTYAYPILKKYNMKAILFVIPGVIPNDSNEYPNLDDLWSGKCSMFDIEKRDQPLCTWREITLMHDSGFVDIQSHSYSHTRIPVSSRLVDFQHPNLFEGRYSFDIPISVLDDLRSSMKVIRLGAPIFKYRSRMIGSRRFKENPKLVEFMMEYVNINGNEAFFRRYDWRRKLLKRFRTWPIDDIGTYESQTEAEKSVSIEFEKSKEILKKRINKEICHFCYPWYDGNDFSDQIAGKNGYKVVYYGPYLKRRKTDHSEMPIRVRRISQEYLFRLPGNNRASLISALYNRRKGGVERSI